MPKITKIVTTKGRHQQSCRSSFHLRQIQSVATSILTGHNQLVWKQRTRGGPADEDILKLIFLANTYLDRFLQYLERLFRNSTSCNTNDVL